MSGLEEYGDAVSVLQCVAPEVETDSFRPDLDRVFTALQQERLGKMIVSRRFEGTGNF